MAKEKNVRKFDRDVERNKGYLYTGREKLSSVLANRRLSEAIWGLGDFRKKRVLDIGCGDGTYSAELARKGTAYLLGVDASQMAVRAARKKAGRLKGVQFKVCDIYKMGSLKKHFEMAVVRGILHHLYEAPKAIAVVTRMADEIIVAEPNGYNPVLKLIEKFSSYHVEHEEKSYTPFMLRRWFRKNGGEVVEGSYFGLVPFFCPDWMARVFKFLEPFFEAVPGLKQLTCAVYVFKVSMKASRTQNKS